MVFNLDLAFRSVKHMHDTLATWEVVHVDFEEHPGGIRHQYRAGKATDEPTGVIIRIRIENDF